MGLGNTHKAVLRGSLSLVAALLLSTAAFAQDATAGDGSTDQVVVQNWHDINPAAGDEGIAVGEPDPSGDGTSNDSNADQTGDDPNSSGTADDVASGDPTGDGSTDVVVDDVSCDGADCNVGDGTDPTVGDGTDPVNDGTVYIQQMDGGPVHCLDCNVAMAGGPRATGTPSEVERSVSSVSSISSASSASSVSAASSVSSVGSVGTVLARSRTAPVKGHRSLAPLFASTSMSDCLALHARSTWICEWQNGAGR